MYEDIIYIFEWLDKKTQCDTLNTIQFLTELRKEKELERGK